jgi:hypothetical protein
VILGAEVHQYEQLSAGKGLDDRFEKSFAPPIEPVKILEEDSLQVGVGPTSASRA